MTPGPTREAPASPGASSHPPALPAGLAFDDVPRPGAVHMERDTGRFAQAEAADVPSAPALTWFTWERPTVSLGRHESPAGFDQDALAAAGIPVCVRPTGGRAVFHVDEWTYVALVPLAHPVLGGSLAVSTRALTRVVGDALELAYGVLCDGGDRARPGEPPPGGPSTCFARSFGYELTFGGRKLMGSAQRRGRRVLLQQGSLLVGPGHERIAGFLRGAADPEAAARAENALARGTTNLTAILGRRPDPAEFRRAVATTWNRVVGEGVESSGSSGSGQA